jgi:hypothetical protein
MEGCHPFNNQRPLLQNLPGCIGLFCFNADSAAAFGAEVPGYRNKAAADSGSRQKTLSPQGVAGGGDENECPGA